MDYLQLMRERHSVREYLDKPIEEDKKKALTDLAEELNRIHGTNVQIFYDDESLFKNATTEYGSFCNCKNLIALVGKDAEACGYVGGILSIKAQELGLNTCFVALTYNKGSVKGKVQTKSGEKIQCSVALGYGKTQGVPHWSKSVDKMVTVKGERPQNLDRVVEACLSAPTAVNQQKFRIVCEDGKIEVKKSGFGFLLDMDLGIVKAYKDLALKED